MTADKADPRWTLAFRCYDPDDERRREALFALGNGVFVTREAAADAGPDGRHYPGTYRAGCYDRVTTEIAGERVEAETLVNLPNWLPLQVRFDGGPWISFDTVELLEYRHTLDLRTGTTQREAVVQDENRRRTRIREARLVSMAKARLMGLRLTLTPLDWSGQVEIRSGLDADIRNSNVERYAPYPDRHLSPARLCKSRQGVMLCTSTSTRTEIAQALRTTLAGTQELRRAVQEQNQRIDEVLSAEVEAGRPLYVEKIVAAATSADRPATDPVRAASNALASAPGFNELQGAQAQAWEQLWFRVGLEVEREVIERPLRLHAFHILQTVSPHSVDLDTGIPARGWPGEGYQGHIFWDEIFVFPFLTPRFPALARALLLYRYRRLDAARDAARRAGHRGAMYPWRSASDGREVTPRFQLNLLSGRWMPDHTHLQRHIGAAIAWNVWQYVQTTGDTEFLADAGAEMIIEVARFWASKVEHDPGDDRYHIRGVIGPDEYHNAYPGAATPGLDDNAYTNIMAVWTLCRACEVLDRLPAFRRRELEARLELEPDELAEWDRISRRMYVVVHSDGVIGQFEGFDRLNALEADVIPPHLADERIDWALEAIGDSADAYQVTKQADVLTLFYLLPIREVTALLHRLGYRFDANDLRRTAEYYLTRTSHRSSLSRVIYAGALADVAPETSWQFYCKALGTDFAALKGESIAEGVHLGAMGGTLDVLQRRYLGIGLCADGLRVAPRLPKELGAIRLRLQVCGVELHAETCGDGVRIRSAQENTQSIAVEDGDTRHVVRPGASVWIASRRDADVEPLPLGTRTEKAGS